MALPVSYSYEHIYHLTEPILADVHLVFPLKAESTWTAAGDTPPAPGRNFDKISYSATRNNETP